MEGYKEWPRDREERGRKTNKNKLFKNPIMKIIILYMLILRNGHTLNCQAMYQFSPREMALCRLLSPGLHSIEDRNSRRALTG